jgi:hypothetical protein
VIAKNHWKCSLASWVAVGGAATAVGLLPFSEVLGLAPLAAAGGLAPDLDKPPEGEHPGATAAEAHGLASNGLAYLVAAASGGHRCTRHWWSTHRFTCAAAVGALAAVAAEASPLTTVLFLTAWWGAWPLYVLLPRDIRWSAWLWAIGGAAFMAWRGWLPETPWTGAAAGLGWAMHIACDRFQSWVSRKGRGTALAEATALGGPVETTIAYASLVAGAWAATALVHPTPFS